MPFSSLVAWPQSAPCLPYCFDNQAPGPPTSHSIAYTTSCVSERKTTAWSLSAARIPDILADAFRVLGVQDFDSVAVEDANDGTSQLSCKHRTGNQEREEDGPEAAHGSQASRLVTPRRGDHYRTFSRTRIR